MAVCAMWKHRISLEKGTEWDFNESHRYTDPRAARG